MEINAFSRFSLFSAQSVPSSPVACLRAGAAGVLQRGPHELHRLRAAAEAPQAVGPGERPRLRTEALPCAGCPALQANNLVDATVFEFC